LEKIALEYEVGYGKVAQEMRRKGGLGKVTTQIPEENVDEWG